MRHNGERRPEEIQAEIARTRGDMDATLSAIEQRLTPGQLIDQGLDYVRSSGANEFVSNLGGSVKNNPIPVALMGIGMAWLMATGNRKPSYLREGGSVEGATSGMMQRASEGMSSTKDRLSQTTQSAKERVGQIGQGARERVERVRTGYDALVREQPLVLGAIGLAVGALLAAAAPRTRREDELMGEASDRLTERAKEAGKETLEKAKQVATVAKDAASAEAGKQGISPKPAQPAGQAGQPAGAQVKPAGRPNVVEPARATPVTESAKPKDPRLGTP
jgi:ElaB/YqjD/DUF883 family membrane-anchored ribosome-binding protein